MKGPAHEPDQSHSWIPAMSIHAYASPLFRSSDTFLVKLALQDPIFRNARDSDAPEQKRSPHITLPSCCTPVLGHQLQTLTAHIQKLVVTDQSCHMKQTCGPFLAFPEPLSLLTTRSLQIPGLPGPTAGKLQIVEALR